MAKEKEGFDAKAMLAEANDKKRVIRYNDRTPLVIVTGTKHYKEGQTIKPHKLVAEQLIKTGIAKAV